MLFPTLPNGFKQAALALAAGAATAGVLWGFFRPAPKVEIKEVKVVETKVEWRERIVVQKVDVVRTVGRTRTEVRPDGTQIKTQTVEKEERRSDTVTRDTGTSLEQRDETSRSHTDTGVAALRLYHLHIGYAPFRRPGTSGQTGWEIGKNTRQQLLVGAGIRLGGLPAFGTATAVWSSSGSLLPLVFMGLQLEL
jgi:hypothetical protein